MKQNRKVPKPPRDLRAVIHKKPTVFAVYLILCIVVLLTLVSSIIRGEYENAFVCLLVLFLFMLSLFIQQNLASDMLGRTFSLIFSLSTFPSMLGIVASGYWVEAWGITSVFMISGWVIFLIGVGANFISSIKQLDNYA